jgi:predicted transglutaminase-like cysteine proteinase
MMSNSATGLGRSAGGLPDCRPLVPGTAARLARLILIAAVVALLGVCGSTNAAAAIKLDQPTGLFGSRELHSTNLQMFPKWRDLLARYAEDKRRCQTAACGKEWRTLIERLRGDDRMAQLRVLNEALNKKPYVDDIANWGKADYWETPFQFLHRGGDCEDFAIAKYFALAELGVPADDMRIVVVQDRNLGIAHAILVVSAVGKSWVLDNQISKVVPAASIHHYRPVYAVNANGWWLYRIA